MRSVGLLGRRRLWASSANSSRVIVVLAGTVNGSPESARCRPGASQGRLCLGQSRPVLLLDLLVTASYCWTRLNAWAPVPLQVYCCNCTPLEVEDAGVSMHSPELSATKFHEPLDCCLAANNSLVLPVPP